MVNSDDEYEVPGQDMPEPQAAHEVPRLTCTMDSSFVTLMENMQQQCTANQATMNSMMLHMMQMQTTMTAQLRNAPHSGNSDVKLPTFDGDESHWHSWKQEALSKLGIANCKPLSQAAMVGPGATTLTPSQDSRLYDILFSAIKNTAIVCKRLGKRSEGSGQTFWNALTYKFEKESKSSTANIRAKLISAKAQDHADVEAFYEFFDEQLEKLEDAGQVFSEDEKQALHSICFEGTMLQDRYATISANYASQRYISGLVVELEFDPVMKFDYVRGMMMQIHRNSKEASSSSKDASYSVGTSKCPKCHLPGHKGPSDSRCKFHNPKVATKGKGGKGDRSAGGDKGLPSKARFTDDHWIKVAKSSAPIKTDNYVRFSYHDDNQCPGCGSLDEDGGSQTARLGRCSNMACKGMHKQVSYNVASKRGGDKDRSHVTQDTKEGASSKDDGYTSSGSDDTETTEEVSYTVNSGAPGSTYTTASDATRMMALAGDYNTAVGSVVVSTWQPSELTYASGHAREQLRHDNSAKEVLFDNCSSLNVTPFVSDIIPSTLKRYTERDGGVKGLAPTPLHAKYIGTMRNWVKVDGKVRALDTPNTKVLPTSTARIISVDRRKEGGSIVSLDEGLLTEHPGTSMQFSVKLRSGAKHGYITRIKLCDPPTSEADVAYAVSPSMSRKQYWHHVMGHASERMMDKTREDPMSTGLKWSKGDNLQFCDTCPSGKAHKHPRPQNEGPSTNVTGELWHLDLKGPYSVKSLTGTIWSQFHVDNASRLVVVRAMHKKTESLKHCLSVLGEAKVDCDFGKVNPTKVRTDGDPANYDVEGFTAGLQREGYRHQLLPAYDPKGPAEREIQEVTRMAKCMLKHSGRDMRFWSLAMRHAAYVRSRLWHSTLPQDSGGSSIPISRWRKQPVNWQNMKLWGCPAHVLVDQGSRPKQSFNTWEGVYVGHPYNSEAFLIYDPVADRVYNRIHVTFDEHWREHLHVQPTGARGEESSTSPKDTDSQVHISWGDRIAEARHDRQADDDLQKYITEQGDIYKMYEDDPSPTSPTPACIAPATVTPTSAAPPPVSPTSKGGKSVCFPDKPLVDTSTPQQDQSVEELVAENMASLRQQAATRSSSRSNRFQGQYCAYSDKCLMSERVRGIMNAEPKSTTNEQRLGT